MTARVNIADLPKHVRDQLEAPKRKRSSRADGGNQQPCAGHCDCGQAYPTYGEWEKHSRATGHGTWSIDLGRVR